MAKQFTEAQIRKMAVGLIEADMDADLDNDGKITMSDARYIQRQDSELKPMGTDSLMADNILNKIIKETSSYSYDVKNDELYKRYKQLYDIQGNKAAENALGLASALTGGYSNSYGVMLAQQEKEKYTDKLIEKGEELENRSYARYLQSLDSLYSLYELLVDSEKSDEEKENAALEYALAAYSVGDSSFLEALGITPVEEEPEEPEEKVDNSELYERAQLYAKYGDYSLLKQLGVDVSKLNREELLELGEYFAKYGDYSILNKMGINTSDRELEEEYDRLIKKYKALLENADDIS